MTVPPTLDAAARDELARKASAARKTFVEWRQPDDDDLGAAWDRWHTAQDEYRAAVTDPDVILALLASVERGEETEWQLTRAKSALENYGRHHPWCEKMLGKPAANGSLPPCNCGYEQAIHDADPVNVANTVSGANARAARSATPTEGDDHA